MTEPVNINDLQKKKQEPVPAKPAFLVKTAVYDASDVVMTVDPRAKIAELTLPDNVTKINVFNVGTGFVFQWVGEKSTYFIDIVSLIPLIVEGKARTKHIIVPDGASFPPLPKSK